MKLPFEMTIGQIAMFIGGRVEGPADTKVRSIATSPLAANEGDIAFVLEAKGIEQLAQCKATAVMVPEGTKSNLPMVLVERPMLAVQRVLTHLQPKRHFPAPGVHPSAVVDASAELAPDVAIGPCVVIGPKTKVGARTRIMAGTVIGGEVKIGEDCLIHPNCSIADYVQIGNRVVLQQGAGIGSDGFGYVTERESNMELRKRTGKALPADQLSQDPNPLLKIPQIGTVVLEDDVEIGSNATIDRATMGATVIGKGSKIDNLVMIAHNAKLGREVLIVAQSGVAGSCSLGDRVIIAGHVGIKDHLHIGKDAIIEGMAGVMRDVDDADVQVGVPSIAVRQHFNQLAHIRKLPKIYDEFKLLSKRLTQLEKQLEERQLTKV